MVFYIENYSSLRAAMDEFCAFLRAEQVAEERVFDSKLAVYELIGNVLKHSKASAKLFGEIVNGYVHIKITASKPFTPPKTTACAEALAEHGRGLYLVDRLCKEWICTDDGELIITIETK